MKINVNAFIAVILCAALLSGLWVLSNSRDELETNIWSPRAIYEQVGGSSYVSPELPTYSSRSSSDDVVVKMSPSRTMSRRVSSVPYGLIPSSPYGLYPHPLMALLPHRLMASSPMRLPMQPTILLVAAVICQAVCLVVLSALTQRRCLRLHPCRCHLCLTMRW